MPKKIKDNMFFTMDTQAAIIEYVKCKDPERRNQLYNEEIQYAFHKLIEILLHKGKFYYAGDSYDEIESKILFFLLSKLDNYDESKGKAYSYFTVITWRFLINLNNNGYLKKKEYVSNDSQECINESLSYRIDEDIMRDKLSFVSIFVDYLDENLNKFFPKEKDLQVASTIVEIIRRKDRIDNLNKKAIFVYVREMTDCKSSRITAVLKTFRQIYKLAYDDFLIHGMIFPEKLYI